MKQRTRDCICLRKTKPKTDPDSWLKDTQQLNKNKTELDFIAIVLCLSCLVWVQFRPSSAHSRVNHLRSACEESGGVMSPNHLPRLLLQAWKHQLEAFQTPVPRPLKWHWEVSSHFPKPHILAFQKKKKQIILSWGWFSNGRGTDSWEELKGPWERGMFSPHKHLPSQGTQRQWDFLSLLGIRTETAIKLTITWSKLSEHSVFSCVVRACMPPSPKVELRCSVSFHLAMLVKLIFCLFILAFVGLLGQATHLLGFPWSGATA